MHLKLNIPKPLLVDLLRIFDKRKFFVPRMRYASVRSKPELLRDLAYHFITVVKGNIVYFTPKKSVPREVPLIHYHLKDRKFYFDEKEVDVPIHSRYVPQFSIRKGPVTLTFDYPSRQSLPISPLST